MVEWTTLIANLITAGMLTFVAVGLYRNYRIQQTLMTQLNFLADTHMQGFQAVMIELEKLDRRVKKLEEA